MYDRTADELRLPALGFCEIHFSKGIQLIGAGPDQLRSLLVHCGCEIYPFVGEPSVRDQSSGPCSLVSWEECSCPAAEIKENRGEDLAHIY